MIMILMTATVLLLKWKCIYINYITHNKPHQSSSSSSSSSTWSSSPAVCIIVCRKSVQYKLSLASVTRRGPRSQGLGVCNCITILHGTFNEHWEDQGGHVVCSLRLQTHNWMKRSKNTEVLWGCVATWDCEVIDPWKWQGIRHLYMLKFEK